MPSQVHRQNGQVLKPGMILVLQEANIPASRWSQLEMYQIGNFKFREKYTCSYPVNTVQSLSDIRYRTGPSAIAYLEFSRIADLYGKIVYTTSSRVEKYRHRVLH